MKQKQQERPGGTLAITSKGARLTSRNGDQWQGQQRRKAEQNIFVFPSPCWQFGADVLADVRAVCWYVLHHGDQLQSRAQKWQLTFSILGARYVVFGVAAIGSPICERVQGVTPSKLTRKKGNQGERLRALLNV